MGMKDDLSDSECVIDDGSRQGSLSIWETADLLIFLHKIENIQSAAVL